MKQYGRNLGPTIIGEIGINMNVNSDADRSRCMERMMRGLEYSGVAGYTLWNYTPESREKSMSFYGDGWNKENLSIFTRDKIPGHIDAEVKVKFENAISIGAAVKDVDSEMSNEAAKQKDSVVQNLSVFSGGRALPAVIRPYPHLVAGRVLKTSFEGLTKQRRFRLDFQQVESCTSDETVIFVPLFQYGELHPSSIIPAGSGNGGMGTAGFGRSLPGQISGISLRNCPIKVATSQHVKLVQADMRKQQFVFKHDRVLTTAEPKTWRKIHWIEIYYEQS